MQQKRNKKSMPAKKGCTYSRDSKGKCRSAASHHAHLHGPGKKNGCSYGRNKNGKCNSKKVFDAKMKKLSRSSAARTIQRRLRSRK